MQQRTISYDDLRLIIDKAAENDQNVVKYYPLEYVDMEGNCLGITSEGYNCTWDVGRTLIQALGFEKADEMMFWYMVSRSDELTGNTVVYFPKYKVQQ